MNPRYPVYVISKGRSDCCLTGRFLIRDGVPFRVVVEPQEKELYEREFGDRVTVLPFSNLGRGGVPARNWVWEHALASGTERHWILDDNIRGVRRVHKGHRIPCNAGLAMAAVEDFSDRYENVAISGLNYTMFTPDHTGTPLSLNVHVYSYMLVLNSLPNRWRGRYNEDTDLCLQVLSSGWCTVLVKAFCCDKIRTMKMKGGNAAELYKGDGRLRMARSLERQWPGVVKTRRRYGRPQHYVKRNWVGTFTTRLRPKPGVSIERGPNEYELGLVAVKDVKSERLRGLVGKVS